MKRTPWLLLAALVAFAADPAEALKRIRQDDLAWLKANLHEKATVDTRDGRGNTPLLWAAALGSTAAVEFLLATGADPNLENAFGVTPLIAAAPEPSKVKLLLAAGANPRAKTKAGHHALVVAATAPAPLLLSKPCWPPALPLTNPAASASHLWSPPTSSPAPPTTAASSSPAART
ncbi:ankyrin repeat domain-containing protein, partial [Nostoc sp. NIES-2111]